MHDPVGYSGVFLSGYTGRQDSLVKDFPAALTKDDSPSYVITREFHSLEDDTFITLHEERFHRHSWADSHGRSVYRYRLIVNDTLLSITAADSGYAWMNATAKPDKRRLTTPVGSLITHSEHQLRDRHDDCTTWQDKEFWLMEERQFILQSRR